MSYFCRDCGYSLQKVREDPNGYKVYWCEQCKREIKSWPGTQRGTDTSRPTREVVHMRTAMMWAQRSLCKQPDRQVGCIITTPDLREILAFGYNGPAKGLSHEACTYGPFGPGKHAEGESPSKCLCLHAEINALIKCRQVDGRVCFVTLAPCIMCAQALVNAGIARVYYHTPYRNTDGELVLRQCGVVVSELDPDSKER